MRTKVLTARMVGTVKQAGYFCDGQGLYLQVTARGAKSWIFRFMLNGRSREMGLGSANTIDLKDARERARTARQLLVDGIDPIDARNARRDAQKLEKARAITFVECAKQYIAAHRASWKNAKHADQWASTIETYAEPVIGDFAIADVDTALVLNVLRPIWEEIPITI